MAVDSPKRYRESAMLGLALAACAVLVAPCAVPPAANGDGGAEDAGTATDDGGGAEDGGSTMDGGGQDAGAADGDGGPTGDGGAAIDGGGMGPLPPRGGVTLTGGSVDRLYFAVTGDTRPASADVFPYPTALITRIATLMEARQPQFALDLGDHVNVLFGGLGVARAQMTEYMTAISTFKAPFFLTLGNHECTMALSSSNCPTGSSEPNYVAFMEALAPIAARAYYYVDVATSAGLVRLVFIADNSWDAAQAAWLEQALTEADTKARYTIIVHHHPPEEAAGHANIAAVMKLVDAHKYALQLVGHTHLYRRDMAGDPSGRTAIIGTGGAPLSSGHPYYGYATVVQGVDGRLYFTMFDEKTDAPVDTWNVGPNS